MAEQGSRARLRSRKQNTKQQTPKPLPCKEMIRLAIVDLKEGKGTPREAILNYVCANYGIRNKTIFSRRLSIALKTGVNDGSFREYKATDTIIRYSIGDTKGSETHKVATKSTKRDLGVEKKASQVTKSKPVQNKRRNVSNQKERECPVKSKMTLKSKGSNRRKVCKQKASSNSDIAQTKTTLTGSKIPNSGAPCTIEEKTEIRNETQTLMDIRFVKQDPIVIQTPDDRFAEHIFVSSLTATPSGKILVVDVCRGYSYVKMFNIEGHHLSDLAIPSTDYDITTANEEEAILLHWPKTKILIVDIRTTEMSVKKTIEMDSSLNAKYVTAFQDKIILSYWCYPKHVKMFDRSGNFIWSRRFEDKHSPYFRNASCIVSFFKDIDPKIIAADLHEGLSLVELDTETGCVIKVKNVKESENILPIGMDVDIKRGILYYISSSPLAGIKVWGSTLDLEHQRELLTTKTGLSVGSLNLCFNHANQQLLVASKDMIDRFQVIN